MASRFANREMWMCVCGHARQAHPGKGLGGCKFCACPKFIAHDIEQELGADFDMMPFDMPSPFPPLRRLEPGGQQERGN